jgi:PRTRC genetic system protein A
MEASHLATLDAFVQRTTPVLVAAHARPIDDLETSGHRYIVAQDGVYAQFRRAWCRGAVQVSRAAAPLPFGPQETSVRFACGRVPASLVAQFLELARLASPMEVAAWITWRAPPDGQQVGQWALRRLNSIDASGAHVVFDRPLLEADEHLVVDIHSHGLHDAHFSHTDDSDDADVSIVKIAAVIGRVTGEPNTAMRLCAAGVSHHFGELHEILDASR